MIKLIRGDLVGSNNYLKFRLTINTPLKSELSRNGFKDLFPYIMANQSSIGTITHSISLLDQETRNRFTIEGRSPKEMLKLAKKFLGWLGTDSSKLKLKVKDSFVNESKFMSIPK